MLKAGALLKVERLLFKVELQISAVELVQKFVGRKKTEVGFLSASSWIYWKYVGAIGGNHADDRSGAKCANQTKPQRIYVLLQQRRRNLQRRFAYRRRRVGIGGAHYPDLFFVSEFRADGGGRRVFVIRHRFVYNERALSFSAFRQSKGRISDIRSLYDFFADRRHLYALLRDRARRYDVGNGDPRRRMDVRRSGNRFECGCDEPKIRKNFIDGILYRHGLASRVRARDLAAVYFGSEHLAFDFGRDRIYRGNRFFCIRCSYFHHYSKFLSFL